MHNRKWRLLILVTLILGLIIYLLRNEINPQIQQKIAANSQQLIIVTTEDWDSMKGQMQSYIRHSSKGAWIKTGPSIPVNIGTKGMAWDSQFKLKQDNHRIKEEGDYRTPAGIYAIGPTFGFNETGPANYYPLTENSVCVDDVESIYYNQLINGDTVSKKDWKSGEAMRHIPQYQTGAVVQYNTHPIKKGAGSCIFLHRFRASNLGTAGCIAMDETDLNNTIHWLDSYKNPVIAIFPRSIYNQIKNKWKLPDEI